jgi:cytoskeleton protein RodZ
LVADGKSEISGTSGGVRNEVSLGKLLTEARKNGGFTAEQVAAETHIPPHYIRAIENDDYAMISDQLYLLPFLRRYAAFIGLDPEDVASRFVREVQKAESSAAKPSEPIPMFTNERKPARGRYGFAIVVLFVLAGLAALLVWKRQALMQHVLHLSKRSSFSMEPAASPSPAAQASESAAAPTNDSAATSANDSAATSANDSAAAQASESAASAPLGSRVTPAPASDSSPAAEPDNPPSDDAHSIE